MKTLANLIVSLLMLLLNSVLTQLLWNFTGIYEINYATAFAITLLVGHFIAPKARVDIKTDNEPEVEWGTLLFMQIGVYLLNIAWLGGLTFILYLLKGL